MSNDRIDIEWEFTESQAKESLSQLKRADPDSNISTEDAGHILPGLVLIAGAIAAIAVAREIERLLCNAQHPALQFDARAKRPRLKPAPELPGGHVWVLDKDGGVQDLLVCGKDAIKAEALGDILKAAVGAGGGDTGGGGTESTTDGGGNTEPDEGNSGGGGNTEPDA
jgi:hypothetical protein